MVRKTLVDYLEENFLFSFGDEVTEHTDLFKEGVIDSFGYIQLMKYVEDYFGIKFTEMELLQVSASLADLIGKIERKLPVADRSREI